MYSFTVRNEMIETMTVLFVSNSLLHTLMLCHWPLDYFEPVVWLRPYAKISKLTITKSKIKEIVGEFPAFLQNLKVNRKVENGHVCYFTANVIINIMYLQGTHTHTLTNIHNTCTYEYIMCILIRVA